MDLLELRLELRSRIKIFNSSITAALHNPSELQDDDQLQLQLSTIKGWRLELSLICAALLGKKFVFIGML